MLERSVKTTEIENATYELLKSEFLRIGMGVLWGKEFKSKNKKPFKETTINIKLYDWDILDGRREGDKYHVYKVPTIQIGEEQLIDPSEFQIRNVIMKSFISSVETINERINFN